MAARQLVRVLVVGLALLCPVGPTEWAAAQNDDGGEPVRYTTVPEHVVGVTRKGGELSVVVVRCGDPDSTVAAEQLGLWSVRPGPNQVRWAIEGSDSTSRLPELVAYGTTPDGFHSLQQARPLRPAGRYLIVVDGVLEDEAIEFRPAEVAPDRVWDGDALTDLEGLQDTCRRQASDAPDRSEDFQEGTAMAYFLLLLCVLFLLVVGGIVAVVLATDRHDSSPRR